MMPEPVALYTKEGNKYKKVEVAGVDKFLLAQEKMGNGLWLVHRPPNQTSWCCLHQVCEIPSEPEKFSGIMINQDELASFIVKFNDDYITKIKKLRGTENAYGPSYSETAGAILRWLVEKQGIKMLEVPVKLPERRLEDL